MAPMRLAVGWTVCAAMLIGACGEGDDDAPQSFQQVPDTVALGELPEPITTTATAEPPPTTPPETVADEPEIEPIEGQIGEVVDGNRLLLIGDSAMATLTERQDGIACTVLSSIGWEVEIEAEVARYLPFADEVIDELVVDAGEGWDVIGLMFGHLVDTSVEEFGAELERVLDRLSPTPILLYTVTQDGGDEAVEVNTVIRELGEDYPNVVVVDWGAAVAFEQIANLAEDGLPTTEGMGRIVLMTAAALGEPASGSDGSCIESIFIDDSAIVIDS
jgi:hypothetical protein